LVDIVTRSTLKTGVLLCKVLLLVSYVIKSDPTSIATGKLRELGMSVAKTGKLGLMATLAALIADCLQIVTVAMMLLMTLSTFSTLSMRYKSPFLTLYRPTAVLIRKLPRHQIMRIAR
jgi:hypothetical protein